MKMQGDDAAAALALLPAVEPDRYSFNMEEFKRAENITSTQMEKDVREEGELHKYMIQAMNKPDSLPNWNQSKYQKVDKAEKTMKHRKR